MVTFWAILKNYIHVKHDLTTFWAILGNFYSII